MKTLIFPFLHKGSLVSHGNSSEALSSSWSKLHMETFQKFAEQRNPYQHSRQPGPHSNGLFTENLCQPLHIPPHLLLISNNREVVSPPLFREHGVTVSVTDIGLSASNVKVRIPPNTIRFCHVMHLSKCFLKWRLPSNYPVWFLVARVYYFSCLKPQWRFLLLSTIFLHVHINVFQ